MTATLLASRDVASVYHASWRELLEVVPRCDALIVDAPYSERTHAGHDDGAASANRLADYVSRHGPEDGTKKEQERRAYERRAAEAGKGRATINYDAWDSDDVQSFVSAWAPRTDGWFVTITDHTLVPVWTDALRGSGRYVFAPLAFVAPGSRVRLSGDGPSQWACFIVVARPANRRFFKWGTLPGAYVLPAGFGGKMPVPGGKPPWLMERLVEDYSRPGDLICDPCAGAGTTLTAAIRTGRRAVGGDAMLEHAQLSANAISGMQQQPLFLEGAA